MDSSLLTRFLDVHLKLTDIYYHPKEILVKFQGQYYTECEFDYHILQSEIQQVSKVKESLGNGEVCLVEDPDCGEWYRGRIVQKKKQIYEVFLIDSGKVLTVNETHIASATDELFQLPPKMVFGIFANILPVDEKWTLKALNYFSALRNLQIKGQIQAILPHQMFLLDVPTITSDLVDLKLGKLVDGDTFCLIVEMLTEFPNESLCKQMPDLLQQKYTRPDSVLFSAGMKPEQILENLQPPLSVGKVEKVKISVAVSPSKFYCQLLRQEMDLDMLTTHMSSLYETMSGENVLSFESLGVLCAAKRKNGQWHRGVIQQLLSDNKVKVWFMDFGGCEVVPSSYVLRLQPEFISVPGFSFACALSCLNDQEETVRQNQLEIFKETLIRQSTVFVQIDLFSADEYLYYVTLHKYSATNTEHLSQGNNVAPQSCPSLNKETSCTLRDATSHASLTVSECNYRNTLQLAHSSDKKDSPLTCCPLKMPCKRAEMKIDSICLAVTVYVLNPSNFWVQTKDYLDKFEALMKKIAGVYDTAETDKILENPEPGKLCCARYSKDKNFYRAIIMKVEDNSVTVSFLDFGNTAVVSFFDVRILLPEFLELPALAIYCSLANAHSIQDEWIKKETDFFKTIVTDKLLIIHPIAKQKDVYIVSVQCENGTEQDDVLKLMIQAGYAEFWEVKKDPLPEVTRDSEEHCSKLEHKRAKIKSHTWKNTIVRFNCAGQNKKLLNIHPPVKKPVSTCIQWETLLSKKYRKAFEKTNNQKPYKEYMFKPGTVLDVVCCHSISPGHFSCQMQNKLMELNNLMEQIQLHYNTQKTPYENGQVACVVKHKDGKWYRAAVLKQFSRTEVDVIFVDYGSLERVLVKDLQAILPDFLTLESQVFRCCLFNLTESLVFDPCNWTEEAYSDFQHFLSSSNGLLTCTVFALIVKSPNSLYNVVDLQSPYGSLHQFLIERGHVQFGSFEFSRSITPSFSPCSFYYSSFNIKIGNEEEVCVVHIYTPRKFYCQLNRNAEDLDKLLKKITEISQMTNSIDQIKTNRLCLARYFEDGLLYRALAFPVESSDYCQVDFVDFGNKQLVGKNELIPIPDHASELFFTPMQAIKCYLADLKDTEIPVEINKWFENKYLGKILKAVIVSKESNGQLGVELYDKDQQINREIKELLKQNKCDKGPKIIDRSGEKSAKKKKMVPKVQLDADKTKVVRWNNGTESKPNFCNLFCEELYVECGKEIIDLQKQRVKLTTENTGVLVQSVDCPSKESDVLENKMTELHLLKLSPFEQERCGTSRKKYTSLKQPNIQPNTKILGYISWVTNPSSFYIHCAKDQDTIVHLAEKLNGGMLALEPETHVDLEEGDVVLAEYEDYCIYRAVVKEIKSEEDFEIEFIDYGNTTIVSASKLFKMNKDYLNLPRLSIYCFLSKAKCVFSDKDWNSDFAAYFVTKVNDQLLMFEFLQQHDQQWEIDIFCNGMSIIELMQREISIGLPKKLVSNLDQITKQLLIADADFGNNYQTKKTENKNIWEGLPKLAYQKIKPGQSEAGEIGHISRNGNFFVKLNKDAQMLHDLNVMAAEEAEKNSFLAVENIQEGLECLTKSQSTLKWYRSEVIRKYTDEYMLVFFMDLGKFEVVSLHDVQTLGGKIKSIPRKAVACKWVWVENLGSLSFENVVAIIKHHIIKFLFLRYLESISVWEVDILIDGIFLLEYWHHLLLVSSLERSNISGNILLDKTVPDLSLRPNSVSWASFRTDRQYAGFVTSVTDPSDFYIQLEDSFKALKTLFTLLSDLPENLPSVPQNFIIPGACCLLKDEDNRKWNRVEVSEVLRVSSMLILTFIDDGLSASFPISDIHKLKVIPEELIRCPRLTYPSCLFRVSPADGNQWNDEAKLKVQEFFGRQGLTFQFRQNHHGLKLELDVFCEQNNAADTLVAAGCAVYTTASFGSINCANTGLLNSQNLCELSLMCDQKNSDARIVMSDREGDPQKSDLHFTCGDISRQNRGKKIRFKKNSWKAFLCSNRGNHENHLKHDSNLFNQLGVRKLKQTHSTSLLTKAIQEIPAVLELTANIDGMQVHKESETREYFMGEVKT